jgi:hypothetical protein
VANVTVVSTANNQTAPNAAAGTQLSSIATCPAGTKMMGGGGLVTTTSGQVERVALAGTWPSAATQWTATGTVLTALTSGNRMQVQAFAICAAP